MGQAAGDAHWQGKRPFASSITCVTIWCCQAQAVCTAPSCPSSMLLVAGCVGATAVPAPAPPTTTPAAGPASMHPGHTRQHLGRILVPAAPCARVHVVAAAAPGPRRRVFLSPTGLSGPLPTACISRATAAGCTGCIGCTAAPPGEGSQQQRPAVCGGSVEGCSYVTPAVCHQGVGHLVT
jgi:hypothetical protein